MLSSHFYLTAVCTDTQLRSSDPLWTFLIFGSQKVDHGLSNVRRPHQLTFALQSVLQAWKILPADAEQMDSKENVV